MISTTSAVTLQTLDILSGNLRLPRGLVILPGDSGKGAVAAGDTPVVETFRVKRRHLCVREGLLLGCSLPLLVYDCCKGLPVGILVDEATNSAFVAPLRVESGCFLVDKIFNLGFGLSLNLQFFVPLLDLVDKRSFKWFGLSAASGFVRILGTSGINGDGVEFARGGESVGV